jgi:hypothetical protein
MYSRLEIILLLMGGKVRSVSHFRGIFLKSENYNKNDIFKIIFKI